ncbi:MAG: phenylalanine--tRNA ligase subunit beta [Candidatus Omnitrophota bacterium]
MKLSYNWLKEYVDINVNPEEVAQALTMSGSEVGAINAFGTDKVMELEITSNRPDCLNIIGLAREVTAVFNKNLVLPEMTVPKEETHKYNSKVECVIENKELCSFYSARIISGVKVKPITGKIKKYILAQGLREVNNVVDITNFCLIETGQPLHAFDLDKIEGGKVIIREARKGEKIITIDGVQRELKPGMLVIADAKGPIAIAGVMGGKDTEVTEKTKNILLESAYFSPISVRRTARILGLVSDSSYRFERGVDKAMILPASHRAALLIQKESGGRICGLYKTGNVSSAKPKIKFSLERAEKILGVSVKKSETIRTFQKLGLKVITKTEKNITVQVPSFREDLKKEIDLIEEVARIYGYDRIPSVIAQFVPAVRRKEKKRKVLEKIYEILVALGLNETMTYSLISERAADRFIVEKNTQKAKLKKPLSEEQKVLTPHLLDGMLKTISWNINRKNKDLSLFEIGKIYSCKDKNKGYNETPALCIGVSGLWRKNWRDGEAVSDFFEIKGIVENILQILHIAPEFHSTQIKNLKNSAEIFINKNSIGFVGEIGEKMLSEYDIDQRVFVCQVKLDGINETAVLKNHYHSIPRFPSSTRDMSILCDSVVTAESILDVIKSSAEDIIKGVDLVDLYEGKQIPPGKKSLTYSIQYGIDTRTLTEQEIESVHSRIKEALSSALNVTFR